MVSLENTNIDLHCYHPQTKFARVMSLHVSVILSMGGGGIPACTTGHMTKHYISTCTGDQSQLVTGQHAGNIKCMMGWVTWYTLPGAGTPWSRHPPEQTPPRSRPIPRSRHPPTMPKGLNLKC